MQKTTKAVVVGLSVLLAASIFASCNKGAKISANVDKELAKEFKDHKVQVDPTTKKAYDFGGINVRINTHWSPEEGARAGEPSTPMAELEQKYVTFLEQNYGVKIDEYGGLGGWGDWPEIISNYCTTGGSEYYAFICDNRALGSGIKAGLYYDFSKSKDIDWTNKKWSEANKARGQTGSSFYAVRGIPGEPRGGIFFNKRLLKEANIDPDSIYDMQKNGTWSWDAWIDLMKKVTRDTDNDGVIDVWGVASNTGYVGTYAVLSNGGQVVDKVNGKFVNTFNDPKVVEAMEWIQNEVYNYWKPQPEGSNWDWFFSAFTNAEIAFVVEQEYNVIGSFKDMVDDWGFVCFPYGPSATDKTPKNISDDWVIVIPAIYGDEKAGKIAKAYDLFTEPIPGLADDAWKDGYYVNFRDERAVDETLQYMRDGDLYMLAGDVPGLNTGEYFWSVVPTGNTPQAQYEATKNNFDALIAEAN